jgi:hypothetical protein
MSSYRLDRSVALVTVGVCLVVSAVAVFVAFVASDWLRVVAVAVAAVAVLVALRFALRPPVVLRLDADGYRSRSATGRWLDVEDVTFSDDVLRLRRTDGTEQQLPLGFAGASRLALLRDVHEHLNQANGYRRFEG